MFSKKYSTPPATTVNCFKYNCREYRDGVQSQMKKNNNKDLKTVSSSKKRLGTFAVSFFLLYSLAYVCDVI